MRKLYFVTMALALCSWTSAQAAEFHVVQDTRTKKCSVVDKRPSPSTYVSLVSSEIYGTKEEAEAGILSLKICTPH